MNADVTADHRPTANPDVSPLMEMTHQTMLARWRQGLVTPMSPTINTFAKTDGSWWTANQDMWQRVAQADRNEQLDCHHDRFESVRTTTGWATVSPWRTADENA